MRRRCRFGRSDSATGMASVAATPRFVSGAAAATFSPNEQKRSGSSGERIAAGAPSPARIAEEEDDLSYINADTGTALARWTHLPPDELAELEKKLRESIKGGDTFVSVPLPKIASTDSQVVAAVLAAYQREAAIIDARLARKVTLSLKATAFSDLCRQLSELTGIDFAAARTVADDKITLFCKDRPARDIMRQISTLFGFTWERTGEEGAYRYRLAQSLRAQLLEEELRNKDRNEALIALDREMEKYRKYQDLSPEQARKMGETASGDEQKLLQNLGGIGWGPSRLYFGLSAAELAALHNGQKLSFNSHPQNTEQSLPPDLARGVLGSLPDVYIKKSEHGFEIGTHGSMFMPNPSPAISVEGAQATASIAIDRTELGQFTLRVTSGAGIASPYGGAVSHNKSGTLAVGISPSVSDPKNAEANARLKDDPSMQTYIAVRPEPSCGQKSDETGSSHGVTSADVLEALHKATGKDVIGDYYTRLYERRAVTVENTLLFDALNQVSDTLRVRWKKDGDWLQFRSTSFFNDRLKEVPNRLLARWDAARRRNVGLSLDEMVEIAQIADTQLDSKNMAEGARLCWGLKEWDAARRENLRPHWRFLGSLSPALRREAQTAKGLSFGRLPLGPQQQFIALTFGRQTDAPAVNWEDMAGATIQVDFLPPGTPQPVDETARRNQKPVTFTYRYGSKTTGRRKLVLTPNSSMSGTDSDK